MLLYLNKKRIITPAIVFKEKKNIIITPKLKIGLNILKQKQLSKVYEYVLFQNKIYFVSYNCTVCIGNYDYV